MAVASTTFAGRIMNTQTISDGMEPDEDLRPSTAAPGRIGRALALMAVSVLAIAIAAVAYVHPQPSIASNRQPAAAPSYQLAAIDFVNPAPGCVVAQSPHHDSP